MVKNLEPGLMEKMEQALTPHGGGQVASSPNFMFIVCSLINGDAPISVSRTLLKEKGQHISGYIIREYMVSYIPPELTRTQMTLKWMQQSGKVDEVLLLEHAARIQLQKVIEQMDKPQRSIADREGYRRDVELLAKTASASLDAKIKTGRLPRQVGSPLDDSPTIPALGPVQEHHHTHEHSLRLPESVDGFKAKRVLDALEAIDKVTNDGADPGTKPS